MQYSTAEIRLQALQDVLDGPEKLHPDLPRKLSEVRATLAPFRDAQLAADPDAVPPARRAKPRKNPDLSVVPSLPARLFSAGKGALRQVLPPRPLSREFPEAVVPAMDAKWYRLAAMDSAVVSMKDQTAAAFYQRDPDVFRDQLARSVELHQRLYREWPELSRRYREALGDITSPVTWAETFGLERTSGARS
jgi:galactofuranosylgalactofuranosylrhamnosyl-N-acetylglucosaminyl-diphospho-decaprenol beta-1,5/1,6-galactofuranosyltransferase